MRRAGLLAVFLAAAIALAPPAAGAGEQLRKIDFTVVLTDVDGKELTECADADDRDCKVRRPVTLGIVAMRSLLAPEQGLAPEESLKRGQLALSLYKSSGAQLTFEEIALLRRQIAKVYGPLVVARAFAVLSPATDK